MCATKFVPLPHNIIQDSAAATQDWPPKTHAQISIWRDIAAGERFGFKVTTDELPQNTGTASTGTFRRTFRHTVSVIIDGAASGLLQVGDVIDSINDRDADRMPHEGVINDMKQADMLVLVVLRETKVCVAQPCHVCLRPHRRTV